MMKLIKIFLSILFVLGILIIPLLNLKIIETIFKIFPGIDKILHFLQYFFLAMVGFYVIKKLLLPLSDLSRRIILIIFLVIISLIFEFSQKDLAYRNFELADLAANFAGIFCAHMVDTYRARKSYFYLAGLTFGLMSVFYLVLISYRISNDYQNGLRLEKSGEYRLAKEAYLKSLAKNKQQPGVLNSLAWIMVEFLQEDYQTACEYAGTAVEMKSNNPDYLDTYGWCLYQLGKYPDALYYLEKAYQLNPEIFCINYHLGATFYNLSEFDSAAVYLQRQIAQNPSDRDGKKAADLLNRLHTDNPNRINQTSEQNLSNFVCS